MTAANAQTEWNCISETCQDDTYITETPFAKEMIPIINFERCFTVKVFGKKRIGWCPDIQNTIYEIRIDSIKISENCNSSGDLIDIIKEVQRLIIAKYYYEFFPNFSAPPPYHPEIEPGSTYNISFVFPCCFLDNPQSPPGIIFYRYCLIEGCCKIHYSIRRDYLNHFKYIVESVQAISECVDCNRGGYSQGECSLVCNAYHNQNTELFVSPTKEFCYDYLLDPKVANIADTDHLNSICQSVFAYPSPVENALNLEIVSNADVSFNICIFNSLGIILKSNEYKINHGIINIEFILADISSGIYFYSIFQAGKHIYSSKFIKL